MASITHDAALWYTVGDWAPYGLAIPNFGNDVRSQNGTIRYLTDVMGRNLQATLCHTDSRLRTPPSINTLRRIHALCTRGRSILHSRAVPSNKLNMETAHALPAPEEFLVFPTPYFKVRNQWLKEYCGLILLALTEAYQHTENAKTLEISTDFAALIGQYIQRVYVRMAVELLKVPATEAEAPDFTLTEENFASYNPSAWFTQTEMIDTVPNLDDWSTEDVLEHLTNGIPVSALPQLGRYPAGPEKGMVGSTPVVKESFMSMNGV